MLILKDGSGLHPEAQAVGPSLLRALQMPQKAAFKRHLLNSVELQSLRSKGGLYLGQVPTVKVDFARLDRVVARIIRGLYWHHFNDRIPADCEVVAWSEHGLANVTPDTVQDLQSVIGVLIAKDEHRIGRDVFRYWYGTTEVRYGTVWLFEFYGDVKWLGLTMPTHLLPMPDSASARVRQNH